jgi:hypothetical protein
MKKLSFLGALVLFMVLSLLFSVANSRAGEKIYKMTGNIAAIDQAYNTVVIEVPIRGKTFTVGGSLAPNAVLEKSGQSVHLADFLAGDRVVVTWRQTESGHLILSLTAK